MKVWSKKKTWFMLDCVKLIFLLVLSVLIFTFCFSLLIWYCGRVYSRLGGNLISIASFSFVYSLPSTALLVWEAWRDSRK